MPRPKKDLKFNADDETIVAAGEWFAEREAQGSRRRKADNQQWRKFQEAGGVNRDLICKLIRLRQWRNKHPPERRAELRRLYLRYFELLIPE